jgi:predicted DNA repair protein MutK
MAGSSLLALIDDIATLLDDVAAMTKIAAKKTSGVLGDDLALNAQQVAGVKADRELPVVWAVAKGSFKNKAILVPTALLISAFASWAIMPLLMLGGLFLCFEGVEKLIHPFLHSHDEDEQHHQQLVQAVNNPEVDILAFEKEKVTGAIRTDFILSAEIIVITLGTVAAASFVNQVLVLVGIALLMTVGVYGLVAGIVRLDDVGLHLTQQTNAAKQQLGRFLLALAPKLMKFLSIAGTAAMFMVGGSILVHGLPAVHHAIEHGAQAVQHIAVVGSLLHAVVGIVGEMLVGIVAGLAAVMVMMGVSKVLPKKS